MNCIQPIAPAELGPMFRPKFDSILLIAASTFQGMPYDWPAFCQSVSSWSYESWTGWAGRTFQVGASDRSLPFGTVGARERRRSRDDGEGRAVAARATPAAKSRPTTSRRTESLHGSAGCTMRRPAGWPAASLLGSLALLLGPLLDGAVEGDEEVVPVRRRRSRPPRGRPGRRGRARSAPA